MGQEESRVVGEAQSWVRIQEVEYRMAVSVRAPQKAFLGPMAASLPGFIIIGISNPLSSLDLLPNEKEEIQDNCHTDRAAV